MKAYKNTTSTVLPHVFLINHPPAVFVRTAVDYIRSMHVPSRDDNDVYAVIVRSIRSSNPTTANHEYIRVAGVTFNPTVSTVDTRTATQRAIKQQTRMTRACHRASNAFLCAPL